jgi:hypothetical protein
MQFQPQSGELPGSTIATVLLNGAFGQSLAQPWRHACEQFGESFVAASIVTGKLIDMSTTIFVDDISKRALASDRAELIRTARQCDKLLDQLAAGAGLHQNSSETEVFLTCLKGVGVHNVARSFAKTMSTHGSTPI